MSIKGNTHSHPPHTHTRVSIKSSEPQRVFLACVSVRFHRCSLTPIMLLNSRHIKTASFHSLYNPLPGNKSLKRVTAYHGCCNFSFPPQVSISLSYIHINAPLQSCVMWPFCPFPLSPTTAFRFFTTLTAPGPPSGNSSPDESRANEICGCDLWVIVIPTFCWMYRRRRVTSVLIKICWQIKSSQWCPLIHRFRWKV